MPAPSGNSANSYSTRSEFYRSEKVPRRARLGGDCQALNPSAYRWMDSAAVGNHLVAVSPLNLIAPDEIWVRKTLDYLMQNNVRDGLFFQRIIHTGLIRATHVANLT